MKDVKGMDGKSKVLDGEVGIYGAGRDIGDECRTPAGRLFQGSARLSGENSDHAIRCFVERGEGCGSDVLDRLNEQQLPGSKGVPVVSKEGVHP